MDHAAELPKPLVAASVGGLPREVAAAAEVAIRSIIGEREFDAREDARAFGALVETVIKERWADICSRMGATDGGPSGRRSIHDMSCSYRGRTFGFDSKTKDLDEERYSDGGVCAVGNLLQFMANGDGVLMVVEVGHRKGARGRQVDSVSVVPFHVLPADAYRIENLGTGQVRLNRSVADMMSEVDWTRSEDEFLELFSDLAISHYERVASDANRRISDLQRFRRDGFRRFAFSRRKSTLGTPV